MLTTTQIRSLKPEARPYKVADAKGLYLLVQPSGSLLWRFRFRKFGVEKKLSFGAFPDVSLQDARKARDEARNQLEEGIDPVEEKRQRKLEAQLAAQTTFKLVAEEYIQKMEREGKAPATIKKARWFLELLDNLGKRPIASITPHELLDVLKRVERRGHHETALRLRAFAGRVFRYGFATLRTERNPADILRGALIVPQVKHHAAILDPLKVGTLLRSIDDYNGRPETVFALRLAPHVFLRPGELRQAKWEEVDFTEKVWRIPAERMKMKQPHAVPLSKQSLYLLQELRSLARQSEFLFPALHTTRRPLSNNTLNVALRRLGYCFLCRHYRPGDRIYLFGFSRGAYTARVVAGMIYLVGLLRDHQLNFAGYALKAYKSARSEDDYETARHFQSTVVSQCVPIHFMGLWDTVSSVIVPTGFLPRFGLEELPFTNANPAVRTFRHAMAIDERRRMFRIKRWEPNQIFKHNPHSQSTEVRRQDGREVWFAGCHADVGGGFLDVESALIKIPLRWMLEQARHHGLKVRTQMVNHIVLGKPRINARDYSKPDISGPHHPSLNWAWKLVEWIPKRVARREWNERKGFCGFYFPFGEPRHIPITDLVHTSAIQRRSQKDDYDPINLPSGTDIETMTGLPRSGK